MRSWAGSSGNRRGREEFHVRLRDRSGLVGGLFFSLLYRYKTPFSPSYQLLSIVKHCAPEAEPLDRTVTNPRSPLPRKTSRFPLTHDTQTAPSPASQPCQPQIPSAKRPAKQVHGAVRQPRHNTTNPFRNRNHPLAPQALHHGPRKAAAQAKIKARRRQLGSRVLGLRHRDRVLDRPAVNNQHLDHHDTRRAPPTAPTANTRLPDALRLPRQHALWRWATARRQRCECRRVGAAGQAA